MATKSEFCLYAQLERNRCFSLIIVSTKIYHFRKKVIIRGTYFYSLSLIPTCFYRWTGGFGNSSARFMVENRSNTFVTWKTRLCTLLSIMTSQSLSFWTRISKTDHSVVKRCCLRQIAFFTLYCTPLSLAVFYAFSYQAPFFNKELGTI